MFDGMNRRNGTLDFEYNGTRKVIKCDYDEYGGNPHIHIDDKYGHTHGFFYRPTTKQWLAVGKEPKWPAEFIYALHRMFDKVLEEIKAK